MNPPTDGPKSILILRLMAGGVFFWEGLLKFVYANQGVGRFTKLGMPFPHFTATFVGGLEIGGGLLLLDHAADCDPVCGRDDRRDSVDENFDVSRDVAIAFAPGASPSGVLGGVARSPIRVCADADRLVSDVERAGRVVAGCGAAQAEKVGRRPTRGDADRAGFAGPGESLKMLIVPHVSSFETWDFTVASTEGLGFLRRTTCSLLPAGRSHPCPALHSSV